MAEWIIEANDTGEAAEGKFAFIREIVRCKDCKHGSPNGKYGCTVYHYKKYEIHNMKPDDFCSGAERRE